MGREKGFEREKRNWLEGARKKGLGPESPGCLKAHLSLPSPGGWRAAGKCKPLCSPTLLGLGAVGGCSLTWPCPKPHFLSLSDGVVREAAEPSARR